MSTLTGIQSGTAAPRPVAGEPREQRSAEPAPSSTSPQVEISTTKVPEHPPPATRQEIESAVQDLRDAMRHLPGGERDVQLLYEPEDQSFLIEIRNKETGALLQTFPPENLLNLSRRSADLLGVLIDRHS
jgi:uncharacterized FlaG/YvyC family protein